MQQQLIQETVCAANPVIVSGQSEIERVAGAYCRKFVCVECITALAIAEKDRINVGGYGDLRFLISKQIAFHAGKDADRAQRRYRGEGTENDCCQRYEVRFHFQNGK